MIPLGYFCGKQSKIDGSSLNYFGFNPYFPVMSFHNLPVEIADPKKRVRHCDEEA
jgi:hypothetical protein